MYAPLREKWQLKRTIKVKQLEDDYVHFYTSRTTFLT